MLIEKRYAQFIATTARLEKISSMKKYIYQEQNKQHKSLVKNQCVVL